MKTVFTVLSSNISLQFCQRSRTLRLNFSLPVLFILYSLSPTLSLTLPHSHSLSLLSLSPSLSFSLSQSLCFSFSHSLTHIVFHPNTPNLSPSNSGSLIQPTRYSITLPPPHSEKHIFSLKNHGCQLVHWYLHTKTTNVRKFWKDLEWKMFVYFRYS
jgi:hypothetical protein